MAEAQVGNYIAQIEYDESNDALQIANFYAQVEYVETYPNVVLSRYQPRILVDFFLDTGPKRMSTEELYVEEL